MMTPTESPLERDLRLLLGRRDRQPRQRLTVEQREARAAAERRDARNRRRRQRYAATKQRVAMGVPASPAIDVPNQQLVELARALGNPEPACVDHERDRLRTIAFRRKSAARQRTVEKRAARFKRQPRRHTAKQPGSRRFKRLNSLLNIMEGV